MISKEIIDEILLRNDIESLIGNYVSLKRAGSNLKGLCPFHSEKTPSFVVYPADNSFYCFGCGIGGDAVTFVKQMEHLDYPDALEFLAKRAGITIPLTNDRNYNGKRVDKSRVLKMNTDAARFFHKCLMSNDPEAKAALAYFTDKRGLDLATVKYFGLGFAPNSYNAFSNYMRKLGYSYEELTEAFLCGKNDRGQYYDAFRNRVMFPIIDVSGNVIAFGGRVMDDSKPKYKNSSDTPVFKKSRNLFALNFARLTCSEKLILCEGYMDVIALHAAGITNAVATLGTAITSEQARVMSRYTKKVIISYDSDEAGKKAADRAIKILGEVGLDVSVLNIPGSKDPDEYIKTYGKEKFEQLIDGAKSEFEYNLESITSRYDLNLPQDKIKALKEVEKLISEVYSSAERDVYMREVAVRFAVDMKSIKNDVERMISKRTYTKKKEESKNLLRRSEGFSDRTNPDFVKAPAIAKNEEAVLGLLLYMPDHLKRVVEKKLLTSEDFFTELNRRIFEFLMQNYSIGDVGPPDFNEAFAPDEVGRIVRMKMSRAEFTDNGEAILEESIKNLKASLSKKKASATNTYEGLNALLAKKRDN
ncbi:MAG: DNA primase [Clostridia bacterium]|nr:DNA primase [Clostridia bacterium]